MPSTYFAAKQWGQATFNDTDCPSFGTGLTLHLYTVAPTQYGGGTEVTGGSYAAQGITFTATSSTASTSSAADVTFPYASADWGIVGWWAVKDGSGNMLYYDTLPSPWPIDMQVGMNAYFPAGCLVIDLT